MMFLETASCCSLSRNESTAPKDTLLMKERNLAKSLVGISLPASTCSSLSHVLTDRGISNRLPIRNSQAGINAFSWPSATVSPT